MAAQYQFKGTNTSWQDADITLVGFDNVVGVTKMSAKPKQKKENNYGLGNKPIFRGYGNYEFEGMIEFYYDEWINIKSQCPNNDPMQSGPRDIIVLTGDGIKTNLVSTTWKNCEFVDDDFKTNQGDTKIMVTANILMSDYVTDILVQVL